MGAAEQLRTSALGRMSWAEICEQHPNEWVCLFAGLGTLQPGTIGVHTWARPVRSPRIEMTDEIRDIVRPRR